MNLGRSPSPPLCFLDEQISSANLFLIQWSWMMVRLLVVEQPILSILVQEGITQKDLFLHVRKYSSYFGDKPWQTEKLISETHSFELKLIHSKSKALALKTLSLPNKNLYPFSGTHLSKCFHFQNDSWQLWAAFPQEVGLLKGIKAGEDPVISSAVVEIAFVWSWVWRVGDWTQKWKFERSFSLPKRVIFRFHVSRMWFVPCESVKWCKAGPS